MLCYWQFPKVEKFLSVFVEKFEYTVEIFELVLCDGKTFYCFKLHTGYNETSNGGFISLIVLYAQFNMFCSAKAKQNTNSKIYYSLGP